MTVAAERGDSRDERAGNVYAFEDNNVQPLGLRLEGMMAGGLLRRQKIDAGYAMVQAIMPKLVRFEIDNEGRANSPWN